MVKNRFVSRILFVLAVAIGIVGFRFVAQAGQGLGVIQNDGYAGTGGVMILFSGLLIGLLIERRNEGK